MKKTLLLHTRDDNQGNQNEGHAPDTIIAGFEIFQSLIETRKASGIKFLRVNCWEINHVTSKCLIDFSDKTCKKKKKVCPKRIFLVENRESQHHHWTYYIRISLGNKCQLKLTILIFWTTFVQKWCFWPIKEKWTPPLNFAYSH